MSTEVISTSVVFEPTQEILPAEYSLDAPEPEHCPGPESEMAGKADACQTCENKDICESLPKGPDPTYL